MSTSTAKAEWNDLTGSPLDRCPCCMDPVFLWGFVTFHFQMDVAAMLRHKIRFAFHCPQCKRVINHDDPLFG